MNTFKASHFITFWMSSRFVSFVGAFLSVCLVSCGGSTATAAHPTSAKSSWQVILTLKTSGVNFGIPGIALDGRGNLYLVEFDDDLIYEYSTSGQLVAQWGGPGTGPGQLEGPDKLAFDAPGNLYVTEVGTPFVGPSRIQKFSATGKPLAQFGKHGSAPGQFSSPIGIAVDQQGDIYVAEEGNTRIQKLSSLGQPLAQWGSLGRGPGQFNVPYDLALDASGNIYVSEPGPLHPGNDRIQKFSPTGVPLAQWGGHGAGPGQFNNPTGLTVDSKGNVFVVDSGNNRLEEFSSTGKYVAQWNGPELPETDPINGSVTGFTFTSKMAVDDHGNMYVSLGNQVVKLVVA
jgi:tripartite motif-containing protein 71